MDQASGNKDGEKEKKIEIRGLHYFEALLPQFAHNLLPGISSLMPCHFVLYSPKEPKRRDGYNQYALLL